MAPALAKMLKNSHGIHLSSPPASVTVDQTKITNYNPDLGPDTSWIKDGDLKKMWQNLSSFHFLDSCLLLNTLDDPGNVEFSPLPTEPHPLNSAFPGVLGMFSVPAPEHNRQEACLLHEQRTVPECGPDGSNMPHSSRVFPSNSHWEINSQGCAALLVTPDSLTHAEITETGRPPPGKTWHRWVAIDHVPSTAVKQQQCLSRQAELHERALKLQRRLQTLLGEHTVKHCNQQLEGLREHCQRGKVSPQCLSSPSHRCPQHSKLSRKALFSWQKQPCSLEEVREFSRSSQVLLRGLQEALDSEATANSSSDEELDNVRKDGNNSPKSHSYDRERHWLKERAELGSRWSWLQLRLSELEGRIQGLVGVYKHIRSNKSGVVLADYKPLTEIQRSHVMASPGISFTSSDADTEPCSPTRLLHNIEKQSAQLNQIVNSLMPPFGFSPPSKQTPTWRGNQTSKRAQISRDLFLSGSNKRNAFRTRRRSFKVDSSCTCARTRPLVFYQKPKLFNFNPCKANRLLHQTIHDTINDSGCVRSDLSSCPSPSSCLCCSRCDSVVLSSDHNSSSSILSSSSCSSFSSKPHLLPSLSLDKLLLHQSRKGREVWFLRPLIGCSRLPSPARHQRASSTPHNSHKHKQYVKHHRKRFTNLSPIGPSGSARSQHSKDSRKKRKRRQIQRAMDISHLLCDLTESSDDFEESRAQVLLKPSVQGLVRKHQVESESVFNINNVFLPISLRKVEKLQCKHIVTPSWRVIEMDPLHDDVPDDAREEDLSDKTFTQRHEPLELKEKLLWSSWGKRKGCSRPTGSGSRMSGCGGGTCTLGEESFLDRSSVQLDVNEQPPSEEDEWLPRTPWKPRIFPLDVIEEALLLSDGLHEAPSEGWDSIMVSVPKNSSSHLSPAPSSRVGLASQGKPE
ncbi:KAT8 regulatory NSL complex subunit 1-like protein isoform X2 [Gouania willdenowi]|uniref:KAT8 regulatory NSL complex subunit 1-like protein isoform X2 n=1 Tax=Gouania willdenowi TaxID=441366 RepID=UPI001054BC9F|nr:KAT8 regulatory NSL complex subunit 1-like protein isoform X2 [Gouania willdenowi]